MAVGDEAGCRCQRVEGCLWRACSDELGLDAGLEPLFFFWGGGGQMLGNNGI